MFFHSFQFVSIGHLFLQGKKSTVPKVEPCEPSPAAAEVASERRNRGPIADAVLSSGQVCVAWLGGKDGLGGVVLGVNRKKTCKCIIMINEKISKKIKAWNVGRCCLFYLEMLAHLFSLLCKDSIYMDSMGFHHLGWFFCSGLKH